MSERSEIDLERLKALEKAATPGPVRCEDDHVCTRDGGGLGDPMQEVFAGNTPIARFTIYSRLGDGPLFVAARNALPAIVAELEHLIAENDRMRRGLERMLSEETDWEDGETGVGHGFRIIARACLTPEPQQP